MRENSLALQIVTIAHVYGHNDFFKNNFTFKSTRAEFTLAVFKMRADRVRSYIEDPSIGLEKVEAVLDTAHALSLQCRRNLASPKLTRAKQEERIRDQFMPKHDDFQDIHKRPEFNEAGYQEALHKIPLEPEEDILLFIRDNRPDFQEWEKDLLTIAHEEAQYFNPQLETKIMNEGWASFWHREILNSIGLPQSIHLEFIQRHNQVVRPFPRGLNPYHVGIRLWDAIALCYGKDPRTEEERNLLRYLEELDSEHGHEVFPRDRFSRSWQEALFEVREVDRDVSFLRRFLTEPLMRELHLFQHEPLGDKIVITRVSDSENWRAVKETLLRNVGLGFIPIIKIEDADYGKNRTLFCKHYHDGRDLQLEYAEKTLVYLHQLWGREVMLATTVNGKQVLLLYDDRGFTTKPIK